MQINTTDRQLQSDPSVANLVDFLRKEQDRLQLSEAQLYYDFPLYKDYDDTVVVSKVMLVSPLHGVVAIGTSKSMRQQEIMDELIAVEEETGRVFDILYSRLIRNSSLKKSRKELKFEATMLIYAPFFDGEVDSERLETTVCTTQSQLETFLFEHTSDEMLDDDTFNDLIATIEGAKGLIRPKPRDEAGDDPTSKGNIVRTLEAEIASFDQRQKHGVLTALSGVERIRGLAGSGKTIVLAMKAALMHLRNPDAHILYTFWTKSLYQHIQRVITRFYRQFDDRDPDWSRLHIMHGWGGHSTEGVYYNACVRFGHPPLTFGEARRNSDKPFDYACKQLISQSSIYPMYDYVFVDEGQDFPSSFLTLCVKLAENNSLVYAYDELQTIFQPKAASPSEFAPGIELAEDIVLYKCYRNPREILVCAHALGFGLYGKRIVQMLENKDHWEDVGYEVVRGDFTEGSHTIIKRPKENSLDVISSSQTPQDIVQASVCDSFEEEINLVVKSIVKDISEGLLPEDILVMVADDRNARSYLARISEQLSLHGVNSNNIHEDSMSLRDFQDDGRITLSTIHKAKGNEAYMVYVVGIDALFASSQVKERNMIFTAMTRAKGWIRLSGIGDTAVACKAEIDTALQHFPNLVFSYPSEEQLKIMKRDLAESAIKKQQAYRSLDEARKYLDQDEIDQYISQRSIPKGNE